MPNIIRYDNGHTLIIHAGREQPYTVWYKGQVVRFCSSMAEASAYGKRRA